jgi:hypothetical protein
MIHVDSMGQSFFATPKRIWPKELSGNDKYHSGDDHVRNFLDCIRSRQEPAAPVEIGHRRASVCHLGNIAIKLQAKLKWDPKAERFVDSKSDEANQLLTRTPRTWTA